MKVTSKHPDIWPEHGECIPDVDFEVRHEVAILKLVGQLVRIEVVIDETKEDVVGFSFLVRQEADDAGKVDASKQGHQDKRLDNQQTIKISVFTQDIKEHGYALSNDKVYILLFYELCELVSVALILK